MPPPQPSSIVVIPLYTTALSRDGAMALRQNLSILGRHPISIVCPEGLDLAPLAPVLGGAKVEVQRFAPEWFRGVEGYNRLMLSEPFYARFQSFDYLLVCQTDAFVFEDRLDAWVAKGYDYLGAPWVARERTALRRALFRLNNVLRRLSGKPPKSDEYLFKVGNGGFSLRRVSTMLRIVRELRAEIDHHLANPDWRAYHVEDQFISLLAPRLLPGGMRIPDWRGAIDFCIDRRPAYALRLNGGTLPFACHGFDKRNVRRFWAPILSRVSAPNAPPRTSPFAGTGPA